MKKTMYRIAMIILLGLIVFILPLWHVNDMTIKGNVQYTEEEIKETVGYRKGKHILSYNRTEMEEKLRQIPYMEQVDIKYIFPNRLTIQVQERVPIGYVPFLDTLLCIDEKGTVLKQVQTKQEQLPIVEGIAFDSFVVGEVLTHDEQTQEQLSALKEMMFYLKKYRFEEEVVSIQLTNLEQIHLYVNKLDVIIGNMRDFDKKVKWLVEIQTDFPMGILDLSLIKYDQAVLKPLN